MKKLITIILIMAVILSAMPIAFGAEINDSELEMGKGVSIMCVGESTTYGNGAVSAYRGHLYRMYEEAGIKANFIGPISEKNGDLPIGSGHAGIGGLYIREVAQRVNPWLECYQPQVIFLTIGGNDTSQGKADKFPEDTRETAPDRLKALVEQILAQHPTAELYVASITPSNSGYNKFRTAYNEGIEPIVNEIAEAHTNVHFIDIGSSITDFSTDLQSDGLHPTEAGYEKMAKAWFDGTKDMISSLPLSNPLKLTRTPSTGDYMAQMQSKGEVKYPSISSNSVTIEATTITKAQFAGGALNMDSTLSKYTDDDGVQHQVMIQLQPKGSIVTMIDEIQFGITSLYSTPL